VDDRTEEERDPKSDRYIYKSRCAPVYSYISNHPLVKDYHNDYPRMPVDKEILETLIKEDIPLRLAEHLANLLVRDPLVIFDKNIKTEDKNDRSHFENFNSTNWNSLRFKPPRSEDNDSCFKVEVRPSDLQLTPFENAAIMTFTLLYSRLIFVYKANFIIPISLVDENFHRAHLINAFETQKFYWRVNGVSKTKISEINGTETCNKLTMENCEDVSKEEDMLNVKELYLYEILCGSSEYNYPGILGMMYDYVDKMFDNDIERKILYRHLKLVELRTKGIIQLMIR
jgi:glutamate--cysteine ligase catalytic subunit